MPGRAVAHARARVPRDRRAGGRPGRLPPPTASFVPSGWTMAGPATPDQRAAAHGPGRKAWSAPQRRRRALPATTRSPMPRPTSTNAAPPALPRGSAAWATALRPATPSRRPQRSQPGWSRSWSRTSLWVVGGGDEPLGRSVAAKPGQAQQSNREHPADTEQGKLTRRRAIGSQERTPDQDQRGDDAEGDQRDRPRGGVEARPVGLDARPHRRFRPSSGGELPELLGEVAASLGGVGGQDQRTDDVVAGVVVD